MCQAGPKSMSRSIKDFAAKQPLFLAFIVSLAPRLNSKVQYVQSHM
jgi:hypothetical protein